MMKASTNAPTLPPPKVIKVDTRGAVILHEESPDVRLTVPGVKTNKTKATFQTKDSRGIYLPNHIEPVSHIAVDVRPPFVHIFGVV